MHRVSAMNISNLAYFSKNFMVDCGGLAVITEKRDIGAMHGAAHIETACQSYP